MAISVECDGCGYNFNAAEKFAGKLVRCPECTETVRVGSGAGSGARSRPRRTEARRERPSRERPERSERQRPRSRKRSKSSGTNNNTILIAGGGVILALLGVIGFLLLGGSGDDNTDANSNNVAQNDPPEASSTLDFEREALKREQQAPPKPSAKKMLSTTNSNEPSASPGLKTPFKPDPTRNLAPVVPPSRKVGASGSLLAESGDRVAWLFRDGTGFAKKDDMWVYSGAANVFGIAGSRSVNLSLYETMRTDKFVELFSQDFQARVRLTRNEFQVYSLAKKTLTRKSGGLIADSTRTAGPWLSSFKLPDRDRWTPIEPDPNNLPPLISAVKKQVARIDVQYAEGAGNGSGFLVDEGGRIVTNYHVIEQGKAARAVFCDAGPNGEEVEVPIVGFLYADSRRDIAVLQAVLPKGFRHRGLPLGLQSQQGEKVVAFGAPLGLDSTTTDGTISGYRTADDLKNMIGAGGFQGNWLQTSTPISPGNSGGPLVNLSGEVLAINTMTLVRGQQLNFAISATDIKDAIEKSEPMYKELSPAALPVAAHKAVAPPPSGGRSRRTGRQIRIRVGLGRYIPLWPIEDTPEAAKHLTELEEMVIEVLSSNTTIKSGIESAARTAVKAAGIKTVIDEGPILLIVPETEKVSATSYQLEVFAHLYINYRGELLRIWRGSADLGRISNTLLRKGTIGTNKKKQVKAFFEDLSKKIAEARKSVSDAEEKEKKDKDPFKDRVGGMN